MIDTSDIDITLDNLKRIGFKVSESYFSIKRLNSGLTLYYRNQKFHIETWQDGGYLPCKYPVHFDNTIEIENFIKPFID